jgi:phytanoyl-CoA hydroxylase
MAHQPIRLSTEQIEQFHTQGYLILEHFLDESVVEQIAERLDPLFATRFETGIYPDEWHGRPGLNRPDATRQMCGMWRCDRTVASVSLSAEIARLNATLGGWAGGRLANDSCWIKPPGAPPVAFHRNNTYVSCINPSTSITCWVALDGATADAGTLEIVPGSHTWASADQFRFVHAPLPDYRDPMWQAAAEAGVEHFEILSVELPPGGCIFLHGDLWHGSGSNISSDITRRSFAVSTLPADAQFQPPGVGVGYIYGRYRRMGETAMDESFFPILWTESGYRSPFADAYCDDALAAAPQLVS